MTRTLLLPTALLSLLSSPPLLAQGAALTKADQEFIHDAEEAAPARVAHEAGITRLDPKGQLTAVRESKNGFTCTLMPDGSNAPVCADQRGFAWMVAAMSQQPRPPAADRPGIAYMAKGGVHYEEPGGKIVLTKTPGAKEVQEPPHWMVLWPFDSASTSLPTRPNAGGTYIMFAGTPYAHLMVYQDPKMLKP